MARIAGPGAGQRSGVYEELHQREREKVARIGGERILDRDGNVACRPSRRLAQFDAGQPVELLDWQLPCWARGGRVENQRVRVFPDGRLVDVGR